MIDTHCHLDYMEPEETKAALEAASDFTAMLTIGTNFERNKNAIRLAEENLTVWAAVGLHPTEAHELDQKVKDQLLELSQHPKVKAIGETGLDYYWTPETKSEQLIALDFQYRLALERDLPLIFHVRDKADQDAAERDMADWILQNRPPKYVLHAFGGHPRLVEVGLETGAYFSFAGPLTYKKNQALRDVAKMLPRDKVMVETDAPFLPPEPFRGKKNHPALARHTLAKLSEVRAEEIILLEQSVDQNAKTLFRF